MTIATRSFTARELRLFATGKVHRLDEDCWEELRRASTKDEEVAAQLEFFRRILQDERDGSSSDESDLIGRRSGHMARLIVVLRNVAFRFSVLRFRLRRYISAAMCRVTGRRREARRLLNEASFTVSDQLVPGQELEVKVSANGTRLVLPDGVKLSWHHGSNLRLITAIELPPECAQLLLESVSLPPQVFRRSLILLTDEGYRQLMKVYIAASDKLGRASRFRSIRFVAGSEREFGIWEFDAAVGQNAERTFFSVRFSTASSVKLIRLNESGQYIVCSGADVDSISIGGEMNVDTELVSATHRKPIEDS